MKEFFKLLKYSYELFFQNKAYFLACLLALLCLFLIPKKKGLAKYIMYTSVIVLIVVCNPFTGNVLMKVIGGVEWRAFWMLPFTIIIAYAIAGLIEKSKTHEKFIIAIVAILAIVICGEYMFSATNFNKPANAYKISNSTISVCDALASYPEQTKVIVPTELAIELRQYDASIGLLYGRKDYSKAMQPLVDTMRQGEVSIEFVDNYVDLFNCTHVVFWAETILVGDPLDYGWELYSSAGKYNIYVCN